MSDLVQAEASPAKRAAHVRDLRRAMHGVGWFSGLILGFLPEMHWLEKGLFGLSCLFAVVGIFASGDRLRRVAVRGSLIALGSAIFGWQRILGSQGDGDLALYLLRGIVTLFGFASLAEKMLAEPKGETS